MKRHLIIHYKIYSVVAILLLALWTIGPFISLGTLKPFSSNFIKILLSLIILSAGTYKVNPDMFMLFNRPRNQRQALLKKRFNETTKSLKKMSAQTRPKKPGTLPWHLVLGLPNAGKTSLLANADIHYTPAHATPGNPLHECDWQISKNAVYLDIPGDYLLPENRSIWRQLLSLLKKSCYEEFLHSILLVVALEDIINSNEKKLLLIKNSILSLQKAFGATIPVNLIINKCDDLPEFQAFFSNITQEERYQPLGFDLDCPFIPQKYNQQFYKLLERLNEQASLPLSQKNNISRRLLLTDFPAEIGQLRQPLQDFIIKLTKNLQKKAFIINVKSCHFCAAAGENLSAFIPASSHTKKLFQLSSKAYFTHSLLARTLPEQPLLKKSPQPRWLLTTTLVTGIFMLVIAISLWVSNSIHYNKTMEKSTQAMAAYQQFIGSHPESSLDELLPFLDGVTAAWQAAQTTFPGLPFVGKFLQNDAAIDALNAVFKKKIAEDFLPKAKRLLETHINDSLRNNDYSQLYALLKAYLMLNNPHYFSSDYLAFQFSKILDFADNNQKFHPLITTAFNQLEGDTPLNIELIEQAQHRLKQVDPAKLAFIILKNSSMMSMLNPAIAFQAKPTLQWLKINSQKNAIPTLYTAESLQHTISVDIPAIAAMSMQSNWVLGDAYGKRINQDDLIAQLTQFYIAEYSNQWSLLLSQMIIAVPYNLDDAQQLLSEITGDQSSLLTLLKTINKNTNFKAINQLTIPLAALNSLLDTTYRPSLLLNNILTQLAQLNDQLLTIIHSPNPQQAAFEFSREMMTRQHNGKMVTLIDTSSLQEPAKSWFDQLSVILWELLIKESIDYLQPLQ